VTATNALAAEDGPPGSAADAEYPYPFNV